MNKLLLTLLCAITLSGCVAYAEGPVYADSSDCVIFDDPDYGEREVCGQHYYSDDGTLFYWDTQFGIWVSAHGYYQGGVYYPGWHQGWRNYYGPTWYRPRGYYRAYPHYYHGGGYHRYRR